jgi:probable F420-dependent oxidoreductase
LSMNAGWKSVSEAYPGRFVLGLGVSHQPMVEGLRGQTYGRPLTAMREYLDRMDASVFMAAEPPETPRRVLAALGPKMLALAAERADGAHPYNVPPEHTARAREILGPDKLLAPEQAVVLETDPAEARRIGRGHVAIYRDLPNYTNNLRQFGITDDDLAGDGSDRVVDTMVAWGDVDAIRARVQEHLDAGADHVAVQVLTADRGELPLDEWRELAPALL